MEQFDEFWYFAKISEFYNLLTNIYLGNIRKNIFY